jgi:hypothetical protein
VQKPVTECVESRANCGRCRQVLIRTDSQILDAFKGPDVLPNRVSPFPNLCRAYANKIRRSYDRTLRSRALITQCHVERLGLISGRKATRTVDVIALVSWVALFFLVQRYSQNCGTRKVSRLDSVVQKPTIHCCGQLGNFGWSCTYVQEFQV